MSTNRHGDRSTAPPMGADGRDPRMQDPIPREGRVKAAMAWLAVGQLVDSAHQQHPDVEYGRPHAPAWVGAAVLVLLVLVLAVVIAVAVLDVRERRARRPRWVLAGRAARTAGTSGRTWRW